MYPADVDAIRGMERRCDQEEIAEILAGLPPEAVGARLARARKRLGLSIRELAATAGVNKNSILRLESGRSPSPATVLKLCSAMNLHAASVLRQSQPDEEPVAVHRHGDDRWFDMTRFGAGPVQDRPLTPQERRSLAAGGLLSPMLLLTNRLDSGRLLPNLVELYGESPRRSHLGEELVYVLDGRLLLTVGSRSLELDAGESATFWSSEEHRYAPAEGSPLPVRVFSVSLQDRLPRRKSDPG